MASQPSGMRSSERPLAGRESPVTSPDRLVVFVPLPERTAYNASFVLARRLEQEEYTVAYLTAPAHVDHVGAQGFDCHALLPDPILPPQQPHEEARGIPAWLRRLQERFVAFRAFQRGREHALTSISDWIAARNPQLILLDPLMWEFTPPFLEARVPIAGLCSTLTAKLDLRIAPVFSDIIPNEPPDWRTFLRNSRAWAEILLPILWQDATEGLQLLAMNGPIRYRHARAWSRVKRCGGALRYGEYGVRLDVPELVMAPRAIDLPSTSRQNGRFYAGSSVDLQRQDPAFDWRSIDQTKPLVYCSLGTYSRFYPHSKRLFSALIDALSDSDLQGIIQIGDAARVSDFGPIPPHILLAEFVPQLEVLEHASLFVTHGGFGSLREGIMFGVPMIVFPCWLDQRGNAARVEHHRLGLRGEIATIDAGSMRQLIARAQDPRVRASVDRMRAVFEREASCQAGVDWIGHLLQTFRAPRETR